MAENRESRKVYNFEFTCPNCKELINSLKTKKRRIPFYCWKCGTKLPLDLDIRYWEEMEDANMDDYVAKPKYRPIKFEDTTEEHQRETLGKIELKVKMYTEEFTCPSCAFHYKHTDPFGVDQPIYCCMCAAKLPLDLYIKRSVKWEKRNLFNLLE